MRSRRNVVPEKTIKEVLKVLLEAPAHLTVAPDKESMLMCKLSY